ncbi:MAG TPA: serine/threonine protein phosphatase, partial [Acidobacteriota bacterium]|nr:serine/threonine protein phosphatase [Acidobacteriota bacterium]
GIDLVTEGILTLTKTAQVMEEGLALSPKSPAAALVELLRESDIIEFVVGSRINEAHQDPSLPMEIEIRRNIIKRIARVLEEKHLKQVSIRQI